MSRIPPFLQSGDGIAFVAPARWCTHEQVDDLSALIASNGFEPIIHPLLFEREGQFAGSDQIRAQVLNECLKNDNVKALFAMRGGYGCARLLQHITWPAAGNEKWLCGFSDITALHSALGHHGVASLHSPVGTTLLTSPSEVQSRLFEVLRGHSFALRADARAVNTGTAKGKLVGGNLSVLYSLQGTPYFPDTKGAILLIEDLDEMLYHLDRMLLNFELAGVFKNVSGIIVGGMTDMRDNTPEFGFESNNPFGEDAYTIIKRRLQHLNIPICTDFPVGHISQNQAIVLNVEVKLHVEKETSTLEYLM